MNKNYALPGNPNDTLDRKAAVDYLVDCCLNVEETEWASCSVRMKSQTEAMCDISEVADLSFVKADMAMIKEVYNTVKDNLL
jgi:hypothetical protein